MASRLITDAKSRVTQHPSRDRWVTRGLRSGIHAIRCGRADPTYGPRPANRHNPDQIAGVAGAPPHQPSRQRRAHLGERGGNRAGIEIVLNDDVDGAGIQQLPRLERIGEAGDDHDGSVVADAA